VKSLKFTLVLLIVTLLLAGCSKAPSQPAKDRNNQQPVPVQSAPSENTAQKQAEEIFKQGLPAYYAGRQDEAIGFFDRAIAVDPNCYQAVSYKGAALAFKGQYPQAMPYLDKAIAMKPDYEEAHFNKAISLELMGRFEESLKKYDDAMAINPNDPWTYYGKASIYARQNKLSACLADLQKAIAIDPSVKEHARHEKDFNNVRNTPGFQQLMKN